MIDLTNVSNEALAVMYQSVFDLCVITSNAVIANRRDAATFYPSPLADELNAEYPALKDDMDAVYRVWDAVSAERTARDEAARDEAREKALTAEEAHGDVIWTVSGTRC